VCRIAAWCGAPRSPEPAVWSAPHALLRQSFTPREMLSGTVNADGYGVAWQTVSGLVRTSGTAPLWQAADLPGLLASVETPLFLAAVRNVTPGIPTGPEGLQPMLRQGHAFAFNGFVTDYRRQVMRQVLADLPDDLFAGLTGVTDTEAIFLHALRMRGDDGALRPALADAVRYIRTVATDAGVEALLTCVLTYGVRLAAVRSGTCARQNTLYHRQEEDGVMLASEPLDGEGGWEPLDPDHWLEAGPEGIEIGPLG
jgi:gamma-glutamyl hercynylcysteine S-oxide hydrolase